MRRAFSACSRPPSRSPPQRGLTDGFDLEAPHSGRRASLRRSLTTASRIGRVVVTAGGGPSRSGGNPVTAGPIKPSTRLASPREGRTTTPPPKSSRGDARRVPHESSLARSLLSSASLAGGPSTAEVVAVRDLAPEIHPPAPPASDLPRCARLL